MLVNFTAREPLNLGLVYDDFWSELFPTLETLNSVFNVAQTDFKGWNGDAMPKMNIYSRKREEKLQYVIEASIAGLNKEDVSIMLKGNTLTLAHSPKKDPEERVYMLHELSERSFKRNVLIPEAVNLDSLKTQFVNGIVRLIFDVFEKDPNARTINF